MILYTWFDPVPRFVEFTKAATSAVDQLCSGAAVAPYAFNVGMTSHSVAKHEVIPESNANGDAMPVDSVTVAELSAYISPVITISPGSVSCRTNVVDATMDAPRKHERSMGDVTDASDGMLDIATIAITTQKQRMVAPTG